MTVKLNIYLSDLHLGAAVAVVVSFFYGVFMVALCFGFNLVTCSDRPLVTNCLSSLDVLLFLT